MQNGPILRFDDFELDIDACELRKRGHKVRLAHQPFRLLAMLAESSGLVIDRDSIRKRLWNSTFVDFEHGINFCMCEIRRALHDRRDRPKYVETLPRRGYRFLASVNVAGQDGDGSPVAERRVDLADRLAQGRRLLREMGVGTLDQARKIFEEALRLDAHCAMAHCGLGETRAMRFISRCEPGDLESAKSHLERAAVLDPELAEPYPWLCYVYFRCGELEKSLEAGNRGVLLLPNLVYAQYFLGTAFFAACEVGKGSYEEAVKHLTQASRIEPRWLATWFVLSLICLLNGDYEGAERFARQLCQLEGAEGPVLRFPGAENLLGIASLRKGETRCANEWFSRSMTKLCASDHTYAEGLKAWCACGMGDVELRRENPGAALAHYRLAWQIVQESPAILSQERHAARALTGLAAAYAASGECDRGRNLLSQAEQQLQSCSRLQISSPATGLAELQYAFAVACVRVRDRHRALVHLREAFNAGWHDSGWLLRDSEMEPVHNEPAFFSLLEDIASSRHPLALMHII